MPTLGVNIDHVATIRQARRAAEPDPVWAAAMAELGGADQITVHLREDRRHIQDRDLQLLIESVNVRLNLECACVDEMLTIAEQLQPHQVCLVPENREEVTTEGGLDVRGNLKRVQAATQRLQAAGIVVSLFVDPDPEQLAAASELGADTVELHTGAYAEVFAELRATAGAATREQRLETQLALLQNASRQAAELGLRVDAGHGLTYTNVTPVAQIPEIAELNIGHSIISRSVFVGLQQAVREMKQLCVAASAT